MPIRKSMILPSGLKVGIIGLNENIPEGFRMMSNGEGV